MTSPSDRDDSRPGWSPLPTRSTAPTPVRNTLDQLASTLGLTDVDSVNMLLLKWSTVVGDELASQCKPRSLRDQVLTIEALDQQWATELKWMTQLLVDRCCDALGPLAVRKVRIVH